MARVTVGALAAWFLAGLLGAAHDHDLLLTLDLSMVGGGWVCLAALDTTGRPGSRA